MLVADLDGGAADRVAEELVADGYAASGVSVTADRHCGTVGRRG